jgi:hypothetical protein
VLTRTAEGLVPPKLLTAHDACYLLLNYDYCLGCLQWVEPAVHARISEAAFASRKWEAGRGVFYLLFLLAYVFTVPITFLTQPYLGPYLTLPYLGGDLGPYLTLPYLTLPYLNLPRW